MKLVATKKPVELPGIEKFTVTIFFTDGTEEIIKEVVSFGVVDRYPSLLSVTTLDGNNAYYVLANLRKYVPRKG